ncbi:cation:proton antiporter [archaeon SCG-AAA382B04]|nr:cation:proton antiporter [archaeon SCG-AAA382B04]
MTLDVLYSVVIFLVGVGILVYSVEELIENITKAAVLSGISTFMLAVIFAGMDFENWAFGVASILGDIPGIAIGSAIGSALFLAGVAVPLAGFFAPIESKIDIDYLFLMVASPLILLPFLFDMNVTRVDGLALLVIFALIIYYIYREEKKGRETFRDEETEEALEEIEEEGYKKWHYLGLSALFVIGIIIGSELAVQGARQIVTELGLIQTVFGMTFVGFIMSLEEILLILEPVRNGRTSIALGNIAGSLIFFSTGNIGLIALTNGFKIHTSVLGFYWPFLFVTTLIISFFLYLGRIKKKEALILGGIYVSYWILSYTMI